MNEHSTTKGLNKALCSLLDVRQTLRLGLSLTALRQKAQTVAELQLDQRSC